MKIMKVKIGYSTNIPIAAYGIKDNAWAEIEIDTEGDPYDFDALFSTLKEEVDETVKRKYPHLYGMNIQVNPEYAHIIPNTEHSFVAGNVPVPIQEIKPEEKRIGVMAEDIMSCNDLKVLETYRFLVKSNPELQSAYDLRKEQLQNRTA